MALFPHDIPLSHFHTSPKAIGKSPTMLDRHNSFKGWRERFLAAIRRNIETTVPCEGCTACCRASQFVPVGKDEKSAINAVGTEYLFRSPFDSYFFLIPFTSIGECAMLVNGKCRIYKDRPKACRAFDCRVFAATGTKHTSTIVNDAISEKCWEFNFYSEDEYRQYQATKWLAKVLHSEPDTLKAAGFRPTTNFIALISVCLSAEPDILVKSAAQLVSLFESLYSDMVQGDFDKD